MNEDRSDRTGRKVVGPVNEVIGEVVGNIDLEAQGAAEKTAGIAQNAFGGAKDTVRDAFKN